MNHFKEQFLIHLTLQTHSEADPNRLDGGDGGLLRGARGLLLHQGGPQGPGSADWATSAGLELGLGAAHCNRCVTGQIMRKRKKNIFQRKEMMKNHCSDVAVPRQWRIRDPGLGCCHRDAPSQGQGHHQRHQHLHKLHPGICGQQSFCGSFPSNG